MRKFLIAFAALVSFLGAFAQGDSPIQWTTSVEKVSDTQYLLVSKATLKKGRHLYSQTVPENGPSPTMFLYDDSEVLLP